MSEWVSDFLEYKASASQLKNEWVNFVIESFCFAAKKWRWYEASFAYEPHIKLENVLIIICVISLMFVSKEALSNYLFQVGLRMCKRQ